MLSFVEHEKSIITSGPEFSHMNRTLVCVCATQHILNECCLDIILKLSPVSSKLIVGLSNK